MPKPKLNAITLDDIRLIREALNDTIHELNNMIDNNDTDSGSRTEFLLKRNHAQDILRTKLIS